MNERPALAELEPGTPAPEPERRRGWVARVAGWPPAARAALAVLAMLLLWYGVVGGLRAGIAPDPLLRPGADQRPAGSSATLALLAALVEREAGGPGFAAVAGPLAPTRLARATAAYQRQLVHDAGTVLAALGPDPGLVRAATLMHREPVRGWPGGRTVRRGYVEAAGLVHQRNREGVGLVGDARVPLMALAGMLDAQAREGEALRRGGAGSVAGQHARVRATAHVAAMALRGLAEDHGGAIRASGRAVRWSEALDALDEAAAASPLLPSGTDLLASGYRLLLASAALRELVQGQPLPPDRHGAAAP